MSKRLFSICLYVLILAISPFVVARAQAPNSAKDPYIVDKEKRVYAGVPIPYGVNFNIRAPYALSHDVDPGPTVAGGVDFYYDTWQLGLHHADYGNVARLAM